MVTIAKLGALLSAEEARSIAADLRIRGLPHLAATKAHASHRSEVKRLLGSLVHDGGVGLAVAALEGMAAVPRVPRADLVWTSPPVPGAEGRTTLASVGLINEAEKFVYAATFSAQEWSAQVTALRAVASKGIKVTVVVDGAINHGSTAAMIKAEIPAARVWRFVHPDPDVWAQQHAKLVTVDDKSAFVTSANFSSAATDRNLECGLLTTDALVAAGIRQRLDLLHQHGVLVTV